MDPNSNEEVLTGPEGPSDSPVEETATTSETPSEPVKETPEAEIDFDNVDPAKLPAEVAKYYKGMQGSYTKKMQGLKQAYEGLQSHTTRLQMLDRAIAGDPGAVAQLSRVLGLQQQNQQQQQPKDEFPEDFQFESPKHLVQYMDQRLGQMMQRYVQQHLQQVQAPVQQIQAQMAYQQKLAQYENLKQTYPDIDMHIQPMLDLQKQYPGLGLPDLYKLATWKNPSRPEQLVTKPGARPAASKPKSNSNRNMTFDEAAAAALAELKGK
jgi:hypothetical protein